MLSLVMAFNLRKKYFNIDSEGMHWSEVHWSMSPQYGTLNIKYT